MRAQRKVKKILTVIFNAQVSAQSMGGGDKIVISITKELQKNDFEINFIGSPEGIGMAKENITDVSYKILNSFKVENLGIILSYIMRIIFSPLVLKHRSFDPNIIWSASDFLPDVLPGFWLKLINRKNYWAGNLFLKARNPFKKEVNISSSTLLYFFSQKISLFLYKLLADQVCVLCQSDFDEVSKYFGSADKVQLISGGIDTKYLDSIEKTGDQMYDASFIGRFHYQKGLPTLIKAWSEINNKLGPKHLAIIGWGNESEVAELKDLIENSGYSSNVHLLGFKDRDDKIKVLKSSLILLFPSNFESWGVVIAEALGCSVPVVAFNLPQIKDNFKYGVLWSESYDDFVANTRSLLTDDVKRNTLAQQAYNYAKNLDWRFSAQKFIKNINI